MCKVQSSIYIMYICISILIPVSRALPQNDEDEHQKLFQRNETEEKNLETYIAKTKLRSELKKKLAKLTATEIAEQSKIITDLLLNHPLYETSKRVAVYINMSSEVQTYEIIKDILESGKTCFIPKYDKHFNMTMVRLRSIEDYMTLPKTKLNITQPADDDIREDVMDTGGLELILVPGLGFTVYGKRLGRGKGYYDRFFDEYDKKFPDNYCMSVGLAFSEQICDDIPTDSNDRFVHLVLHPDD